MYVGDFGHHAEFVKWGVNWVSVAVGDVIIYCFARWDTEGFVFYFHVSFFYSGLRVQRGLEKGIRG